jgi:hypothetical protein
MKIALNTINVFLGALLISCASVHPGNLGVPVPGASGGGPSLSVSAQLVDELSDVHYAFVSVTIENKSDTIIRVHDGQVSLDAAGAKVPNVLVGRDLLAWIEGAKAREKLQKENSRTLNQFLVLGGLATSLVGVGTNNTTVGAVGSGALAAGSIRSFADSERDHRSQAEVAERFPGTHLSASYSIPAGLFLRKWIVFAKSSGETPRGLFIHLTLEDRSEEKHAVALQ